MRIILFLISTAVCFISLKAQTTTPTESFKTLNDSILLKTQKIDSLAKLTELSNESLKDENDNVKPTNRTIIKSVYDLTKNLNETATNPLTQEQTVNRVGEGHIQNTLYVNKLDNKVIKTIHTSSMDFRYEVEDAINANTEKLNIEIYYENEAPFFASIHEIHYSKDGKMLFENEYNLQIAEFHKNTYFTNTFTKAMYLYIQKLSSSILKEK